MIAACGGGDDGDGTEPIDTTPAPGQIGTGEFNANTYLVTAADSAGSSLTADTFTLIKPQAAVHKVGDVLVIDAHGGRLVRIVGVRQTDAEIHYQYEQASLAQAFKHLDIHMQGALTAEDLGDLSDQQGDPEIALEWVTAADAKSAAADIAQEKIEASTHQLQISYKNLGFQTGSGITINGQSSFQLNPDFSIQLSRTSDQAIPELEFTAKVSPDLDTSVTIGSQYGGQVSYTLDKDFPLKPIRRIIIVPVGGVPVPVPFWVQPVVNVSGGVSGTAGSSFSTTQNYGVGGEFGFSRVRGSGFDAVANVSPRSSMDVSDVESEFGVTLTAPKLELYFKIYSVAGPFFDVGLESSLIGKGGVQGEPPVEGVEVEGSAAIVANAGLKAGLDLGDIDGVAKLLGNVSFEYSPISIKVYSYELFQKTWFFPYTGRASIVVNDNGNVADDIFEVALDGTVVGRTNKGGSGQFRLKDLRPGERTLTLTTIEDDAPPGTYEITLSDGLTFANGSTYRSGTLSLGASTSFTVIVPSTSTGSP
ncbi:hypothetical protein D8I35_11175 [Corticibacter populi]|uniref:Uncharacterized protein n=2 Tax=Corticibacter populi TaxID=1550736 RepID=A0A3M6QSB0_9BURK|nr:hypothetical protein D8I35_11175 [Corticibacter populi]